MILPATADNIELGAEALRQGRLVGMPTETVYGVAADALNPDAVALTFEVKGRPRENPLIIHVASVEQVLDVASEFPAAAARLAERFWPGPLTMVLKRRAIVPDVVTGGLDSVAVRLPAHPVARALIETFGGPVTAPSANPFMGLSATRASDIDRDLRGRLALVLDGGQGAIGLESTVVDVRDEVRLLRPGAITRAEIEEVLGRTVVVGTSGERRAPGQYERHYAPRARLRIAEALGESDLGITFDEPTHPGQIQLPLDPLSYGAQLYATLHELDRLAPTEIVVQSPPTSAEWDAVWDRLRKASS